MKRPTTMTKDEFSTFEMNQKIGKDTTLALQLKALFEIAIEAQTLDGDELEWVSIKVDKQTVASPSDLTLEEGKHTFKAPKSTTINSTKYAFDHWEDEEGNVISTKTSTSLGIDSDKTLIAVYREV